MFSTLSKAWQGKNPRVRSIFSFAIVSLIAGIATALLGEYGILAHEWSRTVAVLLLAFSAVSITAIFTFQSVTDQQLREKKNEGLEE